MSNHHATASLSKRAKLSLDESRLLVLGAQILVGFQYRGFLEPGFSALPEVSQKLRLISLFLMLVTTLLLMWPAAFHEVVEEGHLTLRFLRFENLAMSWALLPFALALGLDVYVIVRKIVNDTAAAVAGGGTLLTAMFFWYGWELMVRASTKSPRTAMMQETHENTPLFEKINTILTECRVVIPGSQALLGFQLIAVLMEGFDRLPVSSRYIHLMSLLLLTLSTVLLMAPAAYHRIVEQGRETERLLRFARTMLLTAMAVLAAGLASELFVVSREVTHNVAGSLCCAVLALAGFYGAWFGYTTYTRLKNRK
jgi:hypothetical protein